MRGQGEGSDLGVNHYSFATPSNVFLGDFFHGWPCSFGLPFKHLIDTNSLTNLREKRCQQGLPLDFLASTEICNSLQCLLCPWLCASHIKTSAPRARCASCPAIFPLRAGCICAAPSVCGVLLGVCATLLETGSHSLKLSKFHSLTLEMSLPSLK